MAENMLRSGGGDVLGISDTEGLDYVLFIDDETGAEHDSRDWGLFLTPVMEIPDAQARRIEQQVPGLDGTLDLTDALGGVNYENRELRFGFVFGNGTAERYHDIASQLRNALDGRRFRAIVSDDAGWYWVGRCQVDAVRVGRGLTSIAVTMLAEPFKRSVTSSYEAWVWDTFSFTSGIVTQQGDVVLRNSTESVALPIDPSGSKVRLWLNTGTAEARMSDESSWHQLKPGSNTFPEIRMSRTGQTTLMLRGSGSVGVEYRIGSL